MSDRESMMDAALEVSSEIEIASKRHTETAQRIAGALESLDRHAASAHLPDLLGHVSFVERQLSSIAIAIENATDTQRRILAVLDRQAAALDRLATAAEKLASTPAKVRG